MLNRVFAVTASVTMAIAAVAPLSSTQAEEDGRVLVEMPAPMRAHMLRNMRDHLAVVDQLLRHLNRQEFDAASTLAESRLGVSAKDDHGAHHMGRFMPKGMRVLGQQMHTKATEFSLRATEGSAPEAYAALSEVTATCVACHAGYRIR